MNGLDFKTVFKSLKEEISDFFHGSRLIVFLMMLIFIQTLVIEPLADCSSRMGAKISFVEPFIALGNSRNVMMSVPILFVVLMADFPKSGSKTYFSQIRASRATWVTSQLLFGLFGSIITVLYLLCASIILSINICEFKLKFSYAVTHYSSCFPDRTGDLVLSLLPSNIYNQMTAGKTLLITSVLMVFFLWFLSEVVLLFTILNKKEWGLILAIIMVILGAAAAMTETQLMWIFPMAHTIPWLHFEEYLRKPKFPLWGSFIYLIALNVIMIVACYIIRKKYQTGK
jgi:hypothetical protein